MLATQVRENLRLPMINIKQPECKEIIDKIGLCFSEILTDEKECLINSQKTKSKQELIDLVEKHNLQVDNLGHKIDNFIYQILGLTDSDIATIEDYLKLNNIYVPKTPQPSVSNT